MNGLSINFSFNKGLPPHEFFPKAWASEPLTNVLAGTDVCFALPFPDEDISWVAVANNEVVGQCSANRVVKHWTHVEGADASQTNRATQIFLKIQNKAVQEEKRYLQQSGEPEASAFHSAGIAILPEYRRTFDLARQLREHQIAVCKEHKATLLFCETTNCRSAANISKFHFQKINEFKYPDLAQELDCPELAKLNDSFTVWCLNLKG